MDIDNVPQASEIKSIPGQQVRLPYMPGLDGLRALALIAVLLYHADVKWIRGGFLGVEVFLVLSGYLITTLLLAEWQTHRHINLGAFWLRRARRLFPALIVLVAATLTFAILFLPNEIAALRPEAAAAVGYMSNWYLVFARQSYFETMGRPSLLRHLWSLAVEGQLYLLWPPLLLIGLRRLAWHQMPWYLLLAAAASALWMALIYNPNADPSRVYFGTDTRAAGFCIGAALATFWGRDQSTAHAGHAGPRLLDVSGIVALAGLVTAFVWLDEFQPFLYRGGLVLVAVATATVIAATIHPHTRMCPYLLTRRTLRWLGTRSYSIYLWHWPIFAITRPQLDLPLAGLPLSALRLLLSLVLAECSYHLIETPIRRGRLQQAWKELHQTQGGLHLWLGAQWTGVILALVLLCVMLGESVATAVPPESPPTYRTASVNIPSMVVAPTMAPELPPAVLPTQTPIWTASPRPHQTSIWPPPTVTPARPMAVVAPTHAPTSSETAASTDSASQDLSELPPEEIGWLRSHAARPVQPIPIRTTVTMIGDSVMLGAMRELRQAFPEADMDAAVGRQALEALQVLRVRHDAGQLGDIVVVHLGSNGLFRAEQFDEMMEVLTHTEQVMFVNVRVPRRWQDPVNTMLADGMSRYPDNMVVIDWYAASADRPELFGEDGVHLTAEGAQVYAALLVTALASRGVTTASAPVP